MNTGEGVDSERMVIDSVAHYDIVGVVRKLD